MAGYKGHDGAEISYTYGPTGLMVAKETRSAKEKQTATYLYDEARKYAQVLAERSDKGSTSYTYGRERIAAYEDGEGTCLKYLYDVRGNVSGMIRQENTSEEGEIQAGSGEEDILPELPEKSSYRYTPFGEQVFADGEQAQEGFLYNAEAYDAVSGSYYLRARFYEPAAMRFHQPDIVRGDVKEPQSLNRYVYVQNNPVMYEDPSGESILPALIGAGLAVGGVYAGYKYVSNRNKQQGGSSGASGTGTRSSKSTTNYTGTAKQNKNQNGSKGSSSYQSSSKQLPPKNNGYKTNTGVKSLTGSQQKSGKVPASKAPQKTGTVQKSSGTETSAKACSASKNLGLKKDAVLAPNKTVKTGMVAEVAIGTAPEWGPAAVEFFEAIVWGCCGQAFL